MGGGTVTVQHGIENRAAKTHCNADSLSRIPCGSIGCGNYIPGIKPTDLPCGGCSYCVRADSQWGTFTREADDAVPLTSLGFTFGFGGGVTPLRRQGTGVAVMGDWKPTG